MSSEMQEVRIIVTKLAEKIKRSSAVLRSQHIGRALFGLQRFSAEPPEVRYLLKQLTKRIADSDRTRMTGQAIGDALFGMQGFTSDIPEVQELASELAKKIASTAADLDAENTGRALFGLQGLSSSGSVFEESAIGIDSDEVQFLLETIWDKVKIRKESMNLASIATGMQGIFLLRDPTANNIREYLYYEVIKLGVERQERIAKGIEVEPLVFDEVVSAVRALRLNELRIPKWLAVAYNEFQNMDSKPTMPFSRADKLVTQRYIFKYPQSNLLVNSLIDGFRLDMNFPDLKLNVELDGPTHNYPARSRYDRSRDSYLTNKKGYQVSFSLTFHYQNE